MLCVAPLTIDMEAASQWVRQTISLSRDWKRNFLDQSGRKAEHRTIAVQFSVRLASNRTISEVFRADREFPANI